MTMPDPELLRLGAYLLGFIGFIAFNAAYLVWLERKEAGHIQRRIGPKEVGPYGLFQPVADGLKLMSKQLLVPEGADRFLFRVAPVLVMTPAVMSFVTIPYSDSLAARNLDLGLLAVFAFASVNVLGLLLGAWGSRNKYAVISAARVVSQNVAYEIPMLVVVVTVVMITGTLNLHEVAAAQAGGFWHWNVLRLSASPLMPVAFLIFFTCMLAETNRAPFDMAEAESELIAGAFTEYPGMGFGVFFMGEYANIVVGASLATVLFLGGWGCPFGLFPGLHWFLIKLYAIIFTVIWIRWTFPRTTFYGLLNLSWQVLIPLSFANLILTSALLKVW
ncbi:NADH-quinone oxidoreductase subunit H [Fundidesulfovibrio magnetotacticus]|uniref:NADH-quinone oxidoreductase subunit H n=1 Tax=Fundidesulfovibrio magnetotacticus TaxID=2730080 RepID=A0A6V8M157_9BACT|nr:NADH-quinone oxidoreductase subunit NuoH [Fundidesulfovibrio magnetotacticus]GFK94195.1 NADH-quinone oxidoreductase subunit H [Fundidesulfovibrio magnetotacticus]